MLGEFVSVCMKHTQIPGACDCVCVHEKMHMVGRTSAKSHTEGISGGQARTGVDAVK